MRMNGSKRFAGMFARLADAGWPTSSEVGAHLVRWDTNPIGDSCPPRLKPWATHWGCPSVAVWDPLSKRPPLRIASTVGALVLIAAGAALAQSGKMTGLGQGMRDLIEQALDQQVDFTIEKQPLSSAFKLIGEKTGVKLTIRPNAVELLPYGDRTTVSATIKGVSLREGLSQMLTHLGMKLHVREKDVEIVPVEPLRRICRRATWSELRQLHQLLTTPYSAEAMAKLPLNFNIRSSGDPKAQLLEEAKRIGRGTLAEVLEAACGSLGWTWYPWDNWIVVLPETEQVQRFLDRPITLKYNHAALADVLRDLAEQAALNLRLEPGVLKGLPVQTQQNFNLMMRDSTIGTALELISGATGLAYEVTPDELIIKHTKTSKAAATQVATVIRSDDPIVGQVTVPDESGAYRFQFFIRESDLSPELNAWRKAKIREAVEKMERQRRSQ